MSASKSLRDRLAENASQGVQFVAKHGEAVGLTVASVAVLAAVALVAGQHGAPTLTNQEMLSSTLGLLTVSSFGMTAYLGSKTFESVVKETAPEWLPQKDGAEFEQAGQTALPAKMPAVLEAQTLISQMGDKLGDRLIKLSLGTPLEKVFDADRVADYKNRKSSDMRIG
jgi:hypothetical protein